MRYEYTNQFTTTASVEALWRVWTDIDRWADWDHHIASACLDGRFEEGGTALVKPVGAPGGTSTLADVVPFERWSTVSRTPFGPLTFTHTITDDGPTRTITEHLVATGLMAPLFRLVWARRRQAAGRATLVALATRADQVSDPAPTAA